MVNVYKRLMRITAWSPSKAVIEDVVISGHNDNEIAEVARQYSILKILAKSFPLMT